VLTLYDRQDLVEADKVAGYVTSLQLPDGSFMGDKWGEWRGEKQDREGGGRWDREKEKLV